MNQATDTPVDPVTPAAADALGGLRLPAISPTADLVQELQLRRQLNPAGWPDHALGRLETLGVQLALIRPLVEAEADEAPQLVVFAADHGIADEGISAHRQAVSTERVTRLLAGEAPVNALLRQQGFSLTVVDAGLAMPLPAQLHDSEHAQLLVRKIGHGTRNMALSAAMSLPQAVAALHAGMDVVRHLPGQVLALGSEGVANDACAIQLLSRLCGVPLADACGQLGELTEAQNRHRLEVLFAAAQRHRKAVTPLEALATMGGFEIAMLTGAMLQAASERRVVLVDGFVASAAALVARGLSPAVADYLVYAHRSAEIGHRLLMIHLQAQPLLDLDLRCTQGVGALLAWPLLQAARHSLQP